VAGLVEQVATLTEQVGSVATEMAAASEQLKTFQRRAQGYEEIIRGLNAKVLKLQADQIQELFGPVLRQLAQMLTLAVEGEAEARHPSPGYSAQVEFESFISSLTDALEMMGVSPVEAVLGGPFDATKHSARRVIVTQDPALGSTIARVFRQGLIRHGAERAFLPAQVSIYRYEAAELSASGASEVPAAEPIEEAAKPSPEASQAPAPEAPASEAPAGPAATPAPEAAAPEPPANPSNPAVPATASPATPPGPQVGPTPQGTDHD
jgi:molecular chaperone GrpE (heat shock protein)